MATYLELVGAARDSDLQDKVLAAVSVGAITIHNEDPVTTNHANRLLWAKATLSGPSDAAAAMLRAVLAINESASLGSILGATDAAIQANVDSAVDLFADGT